MELSTLPGKLLVESYHLFLNSHHVKLWLFLLSFSNNWRRKQLSLWSLKSLCLRPLWSTNIAASSRSFMMKIEYEATHTFDKLWQLLSTFLPINVLLDLSGFCAVPMKNLLWWVDAITVIRDRAHVYKHTLCWTRVAHSRSSHFRMILYVNADFQDCSLVQMLIPLIYSSLRNNVNRTPIPNILKILVLLVINEFLPFNLKLLCNHAARWLSGSTVASQQEFIGLSLQLLHVLLVSA